MCTSIHFTVKVSDGSTQKFTGVDCTVLDRSKPSSTLFGLPAFSRSQREPNRPPTIGRSKPSSTVHHGGLHGPIPMDFGGHSFNEDDCSQTPLLHPERMIRVIILMSLSFLLLGHVIFTLLVMLPSIQIAGETKQTALHANVSTIQCCTAVSSVYFALDPATVISRKDHKCNVVSPP